MKKTINYIKCRIALGFPSLLYPICDQYDVYLKKCLESGIDSIDMSDMHFGKCVFKNGVYYKFWNCNKYYAWLIYSEFRGKISYKSRSQRPRVDTIYAFREEIKKSTATIPMRRRKKLSKI